MDFRSPVAWMSPLRRGQVFAFASFLFLIAVAMPAAAGVVTATPITFTVAEGTSYNDMVAMFTDSDDSTNASSFTATIDWGDGTAVTPGTIAQSDTVFFVLGQHTYDDEGTFTVTVVINEVAGPGTATATSTATVTESDVLSGTPTTFSAPSGASFTAIVGNFSDTFTANTPSDFTAMIAWGDATMSAGTIVATAPGMYQVSGTHTYAAPGTYSVIVSFIDDAPGTAMAQVTSTAHVAAGLAVTAVNLSTAEGMAFNGTVATFSDADTTKTPASFAVTIAWGDGTTSAGTVTGGSGSFTVNGQHTYADEGSFTFTVTVTEIGAGGLTASGSGTATVSESDVLTGNPTTFSAQAQTPVTAVVATFTDTYTGNDPDDFTATINWGDGSTTAGTVSGGGGTFTVTGTHTYTSAGTFNVVVTLADDAPGTATATTTGTANVSAPIAAVPALDLRGLLLLGIALGAAGLYFLRRA